jgi:EAL domain-containing protein (putative c-di-GMP-specific phosphodiesterase class I)/GGDEF domain-containing protein
MRILRRLRNKLTVLYAGLFCVALLLIGATAYAVVANTVQQQVRQQLAATGVVFDRVWQLRFEQLRDGARLASRDYGFRQAVATQDDATIISALTNLQNRLDADVVFLVTMDGRAVGASVRAIPDHLQRALDAEEAPFGVLETASGLHQAVTMPVFAPNMLGWIVVGERLDEGEMQALERLSAIPLQAEVIAGGRARNRSLSTLIASARDHDALGMLNGPGGRAVALAKPLHAMDGAPAILLLRYPLASAFAPYQTLFASLLAIGLAALAVLIAGSWLLARDITRPLSSLSVAAQRLQQGIYEPVEVSANDEISDLADSFNAMIGALRDRERKIVHLAYHDAESRLPNRLALERRLSSASPARRYLAAVGIDRFAHVRGAIGYAHSEALVRRLGARLAKLAPNALLARLSSDVLVIAYSADTESDAGRRVAELIAALEHPISVESQGVDVNVTVGVAHPRAADETPAVLIKRASIALDQARAARAKFAFFDEAAYGNPAHNLSLMGEMRHGLTDGSIYLAHQPKYNIRARSIEGVECLIRWRHPARGMIGPDLFVPMAEETGHIRAMTDWVLSQAIEDQRQLARLGHPLTMSINISGRLLGDADFAEHALKTVREAVGALCFEITETAVIDNPTIALRNIHRFAESGIKISIDDYGSGLSSLAYLRQLPAHELKIDKMFIQNLTNGQRDALLVRSTIDLAHGLGLTVTAEGVEHPAAFSLLAGMGCDMAQGHLLALPMPLADIVTILEGAGAINSLPFSGAIAN